MPGAGVAIYHACFFIQGELPCPKPMQPSNSSSFRYFDSVEVRIDGYPVVITRTGFTNELGWEFYLEPEVDAARIGERIMEAGRPYGMQTTPAEVANARRLEGGLMFAGTDFDEHVTPYDAGFEKLVELDSGDFIGRDALAEADRRQRIWGLTCADGEPRRGIRGYPIEDLLQLGEHLLR